MTAACFAPPPTRTVRARWWAASGGARKGVLAEILFERRGRFDGCQARPGPPTGGADYSFDWIGGSMLAGGRPIRLRGR